MGKRTMQAMVVTGPGKAEPRIVPIPEPGPGEVRVRLKGCGVCASNLATWEGMPWTQYPTEPGDLGHEGWGEIDAIGNGVTHLKIGDSVASLGSRSYAEYDLARADAVVKIPEPLRGKPFPGEAFGCAMNIFRRSEIQRGQTVAVVGVGFLGAMLIRLAKQVGAHVIAISRRPFSLQLAKRMGADEIIPMADHYQIIEKVRDLTAGRFCERVIEAVGKQWPLDLAAELTAERGRLIIAGYHQDGPRQVNLQLWNWRGIDVINAHERDPKTYVQGIEAAAHALVHHDLDPALLCTHSFPLERLGDALNASRDRPDGFLKAWVEL